MLTAWFRDRANLFLASWRWQVAAVMLIFLLLGVQHAGNDGLWFQGDSPRHGTNGFFWWDLLQMHPASPADFALSYYARYPVINPLAYPPLFYVLEGFAFRVFGPSPFVAKWLVLAFAGLTGFYTMAWARRWLGPAAGWAGAFLAFVPGVVLWSNAVMLNIPATALGLASLYHFRRWFESGEAKQLIGSTLYVAAAVLTYYPGGIAICICIAWSILLGRRTRPKPVRVLWVGAAAAVLVPLGLAAHLAPLFASRNLPAISTLTNAATWAFYPTALRELIGPAILVLGCAGLLAGLWTKALRSETLFILIWIAAAILTVSFLPAKSPRYILVVAPAFVLAAAVGIASLSRFALLCRPEVRAGLLAVGFAAGIWSAAQVRLPAESGFREVVAYLQEHAPADPVLYDGYHDGLFGFYVRAMDPRFERRVVLASQILYHYGPAATFNWIEASNAASTEEVINLLRTKSGCRWIAIEIGPYSEWAKGQRLLRQAVIRPEFEFVRSFPVTSAHAQRIDLYRLVRPGPPTRAIDLTLPSYTDRVFAQVVPISK